ncbi:MAG: TonB-dependent receptor [Betaproteobacteria bacterium]|nr:TonB-dependent receptor [Betaproteobacteria bacterium]
MSPRIRPLAAAVAVACCTAVPAHADTQALPSVIVTAPRDIPLPVNAGTLSAGEIAARRSFVSDTAQLFGDIPGFSFYSSGGVSGIPVIRGLNDDRIGISIDGMSLTSACANHMNPPLSYIDPANVGRAAVVAGISPVSLGGDSIAGTIVIDSTPPVFSRAGEENLLAGSLSGFYRSNGGAVGVSATANVAGESVSLSYTGAGSRSGNYEAGDGSEVKSTRYESQNHAISLAARGKDQLVVASIGVQRIPYQAYPNAWMDMVGNDAAFGNIRYEGLFGWGRLEAKAFYEHTRHEMNFLADKQPGDMPMNTDGKNMGYLLKADVELSGRDSLRIGTDFQRFLLDDWWPPVAGSPMMGPGTFENINGGRRDRFGAFAEWEARWSGQWTSLLGARYDRVGMDTGDVQPYSWTGMMQAVDIAAANAFNASDHQRSDNHFDVTALARYTRDSTSTFEAGYARKTRSPNLYERFAWGRGRMAMRMNGWFGDGNGYVGDLDLRPEVADTISATASWHDAAKSAWSITVTPYTTRVKDFIDVNRCSAGTMGGCPLTGGMPQTASTGFVYLQFANHDARLYGIDVSGKALLAETPAGKFSGRGVLGYVRGENLDTHDNLYHMMPLNAKLALDHQWNRWSSTLEAQLVAAKDDVQAARNETTTAGYALLNLRTSYDWGRVRLDAGIENLLDRNYDMPLGGAYIGERGTQAWGNRVAGIGRSLYVGVGVKF